MGTFNRAKGIVPAMHNRVKNNDPATSGIVLILLSAAVSDAVMEDYSTLTALLAANTECVFDNYSRKVLTDAEIASSVIDNTANSHYVNVPAVTYTSAGGTTDETVIRGIVCYVADVADVAVDANLELLTYHTTNALTNGNNLNLNAGTYFTATA